MGKLLTAVTTASALLPAAKALAEATSFDVRKTNGCGYCLAWMEHLEENGFAPAGQDMFDDSLVDGCVIEGHVPASYTRRLLEERLGAVGVAVPEMPLGSPDMDFGRRRGAYDVFLIREDDSTEVFANYNGNG